MGDPRSGPIPSIGVEPQAPIRPQHPLANYQFSSDELRVLRECNTESFFQRSLPIGTSLGLAAYFGVKQGLLSPNPKYGAVPKVVVSVIIGYFVGKFSYQRKCAEKIMQLPNSKLAQLLRQKKRGSIYQSLSPDQGLGAGFGLSPFQSATPEVYSDEDLKYKQESTFDLDMERPTQSGLDDTFRLTLDSPATRVDNNAPSESARSSISYDELRKRNREEYSKRSQNAFVRPLPPGGPSVTRSSGVQSEEPSDGEISKEKNRYGDVWT